MAEKLAAAGGRRRHEVFQDGELGEGFAKSDEFARRGQAKRDAPGKAFEILDALQLLANLAADDSLLNEMGDRGVPRFDGFAVDERAENPGAQQPRAHSGDGYVERGNQRGWAARASRFLREDGCEELEISNGDGVENEGIVLFVVADGVEMAQGFDAGG